MAKENNTEATRKNVPPPKVHRIRGLRLSDLPTRTSAVIQQIAQIVLSTAGRLDLQIRDGYINVYYQGGSIWKVDKITPRSRGLLFSTNKKYFHRGKMQPPVDSSWLPGPRDGLDVWNTVRGQLETVMVDWFNLHPKKERDLQHKCACNHLLNKSSKWIVVDIEYGAWLHGKKVALAAKDSRRLCKFDMVAFERSSLETKGELPVYLVELKVQKRAVAGASGVTSHAKDFQQLLCNKVDVNALSALKESIKNIIRDKVSLGLLPGVPAETANRDIVCRPIFVLKDVDLDSGERNNIEEILASCSDSKLWLQYTSYTE